MKSPGPMRSTPHRPAPSASGSRADRTRTEASSHEERASATPAPEPATLGPQAPRPSYHLSSIPVHSPRPRLVAPSSSSPVIQLARDRKRRRTNGSSGSETIVLDPRTDPTPSLPPVPPPPTFQPFSGTGYSLQSQSSSGSTSSPQPRRGLKRTLKDFETDSETDSETGTEPERVLKAPTRSQAPEKKRKRSLKSESESDEDPLERLQIHHFHTGESEDEALTEPARNKGKGKAKVSEDEALTEPARNKGKGKAKVSEDEAPSSTQQLESDEEEDFRPRVIEARAIQNYMRATGRFAMYGTLSFEDIQRWSARDLSPDQYHPMVRDAFERNPRAVARLQLRHKAPTPQPPPPTVSSFGKKKKKPQPKPKPKPDYSDDESDEISNDKTREHYVQKVIDDIKEGKNYNDTDSSDSDEAIDSDHPEESKAKRRTIKLAELKALAQQTRPLTDEQLEDQQEFQAQRENDYAQRPKKRRRYTHATQDRYQQLAENFEATSFLHNSLLRRAFRRAIPDAKVAEGGSKNYDNSQGKIRDALRGLVSGQLEEFSDSDFSNPEDYETLQHISKYRPSNDKRKRRLHEAIASGDTDDASASTITEFHHIGFKEAHKSLGTHALNPANLTLLFGERSTKNSSRAHGGHQQAHDLQGFQPPDKNKKTWHGRGRGGVFKNIDAEATHYITRHVGRKRTSKKELYKVDPEELGYETDTEAPSPPEDRTPPLSVRRQLAADAAERRRKKQQEEEDKKKQR